MNDFVLDLLYESSMFNNGNVLDSFFRNIDNISNKCCSSMDVVIKDQTDVHTNNMLTLMQKININLISTFKANEKKAKELKEFTDKMIVYIEKYGQKCLAFFMFVYLTYIMKQFDLLKLVKNDSKDPYFDSKINSYLSDVSLSYINSVLKDKELEDTRSFYFFKDINGFSTFLSTLCEKDVLIGLLKNDKAVIDSPKVKELINIYKNIRTELSIAMYKRSIYKAL